MTATHARRPLNILVAVAALTLAAACADNFGNSDDGADVGSSSAPSEPHAPCNDAGRTGASLPRDGAPKVARPLCETSRWENTPCEVLTKQKLATLDFDPYRVTPTGDGGGPGCDYDQLSVITAYTTIGTRLPDGLSGLYAEKADFELFEPTDPLKGHPAVIADTTDRREQGRCAVIVGLREDLTYRTIVEADPRTRPGKNPCKFAADLTVLALHTMQEGRP